jgi:hypothetical protein
MNTSNQKDDVCPYYLLQCSSILEQLTGKKKPTYTYCILDVKIENGKFTRAKQN